MKKRVMFIVPSLRGGGAQRVMVTLLRHLDRNKFVPILVLLTTEGKYLNDVPGDVPLYNLDTYRVRHSICSLIKIIRKQKPDVVFSTQGHLNLAIIAIKPFIGRKTRVIVREANTVSEEIKGSKISWIVKFLYKMLYRRADLVICQSKYMMNDLIENFQVPKEKLAQIYNPVDIERIDNLATKDGNPFCYGEKSLNIVALGRLANQKGFDRLIASIPKLIRIKPEAQLWIIGEGNLKEQLQNQRDQLGLTNHVKFIDFQDNPYKWLKNADLFVLSSYFEGLPNVLLEAIACNCPVIAVQHPGGTKEIMEITMQKDRYVSNLEWEESWFSKPKETSKDCLTRVFHVSKITRRYEDYFALISRQ